MTYILEVKDGVSFKSRKFYIRINNNKADSIEQSV